MTDILALKYRPTKFADVTGQVRVTSLLQSMVVNQRVPPALIFSGASGSGKTSSARIFSRALNCLNVVDGEPCNHCDGCNLAGGSVIEIDGASAGGVEEVRKLQEVVNYAHAGTWRVVILDECHSMSKDAFNALLKILEEPPANTVFILLTTEVYKIPETVANRAWDMEFRKIGLNDVFARVKFVAEAEDIVGVDALWREIAKTASGGLRKALMLLDQAASLQVADVHTFQEMFGSHDSGQELLEAVAADKGIYEVAEREVLSKGSFTALLDDVSGVLRDLLLLSCGAELDLPEADVARRRVLLSGIDLQRVPVVFNIISSVTSTYAKEPDVVKAAQIFASLLQRALKPASEQPKTPIIQEKEAPRVATAAELRAMAGSRK